jgi:hypothetical protein
MPVACRDREAAMPHARWRARLLVDLKERVTAIT